jgi:PhnB protein
MPNPIPDGYSAITPYLAVDNAASFIEFITSVFDAQIIERIDGEGGLIMHGEAKINGAMLMFADACEKFPVTRAGLYVYVDDVDGAWQRAVDAGATSEQEPKDQFYGDRSGGFKDRWGNTWWVANHVEDVSPEEIARRSAEWMQKNAQTAQ